MGGAGYQPLDPHNQRLSSKHHGRFVSRPACAWLVLGVLSMALLHLLCCSPPGTQQAVLSPLRQYINNTYSFVSSVYVTNAERLDLQSFFKLFFPVFSVLF